MRIVKELALWALLAALVALGAAGMIPISAKAQSQGQAVTIVNGGFDKSGRSTDISATTSSSSVALPTTAGETILVMNVGSNTVFVQLGSSTVAATTTAGLPIFSNSSITLARGGNTHIAAITASSTSTVSVLRGAGVPAMAGGGSAGGGGGGSVTQGTIPWIVGSGLVPTTLTGWTSATAADTTQILFNSSSGITGPESLTVQLNQTTTIAAGAVTFEGTYDNTNWVTIPVAQVLNPSTFASLTNPYTLVASTNQPFLILPQGYQATRIRLSTQITGSATVTPFVALLNYNPTIGAILNPIAGITPVKIDQTTFGTTNGVQALAGATGGSTLSGVIAPATPAGVNLKASAGTLYGVQCTTIQATPVYLKFYNSASAPTCGSGTPVGRWMCPSAATAANGAGNNPTIPAVGVAFGTGLGYCVTGALADNDTTAITAANTLVNIEWK